MWFKRKKENEKKEEELSISELEKENFSLKTRINYLERQQGKLITIIEKFDYNDYEHKMFEMFKNGNTFEEFQNEVLKEEEEKKIEKIKKEIEVNNYSQEQFQIAFSQLKGE